MKSDPNIKHSLDKIDPAQRGIDLVKEKPNEKEKDRLKRAAQNFEAIFVSQILRNMRRSNTESGLFGNGMSGDIYGSMFDEKIAEAIASKGGLGIADIIIESIKRNEQHNVPDSGKHILDLRSVPSAKAFRKSDDYDRERSIIKEASERYDLDPKLIMAVMLVESDFRKNAVSNKGAAGLMQLMESTAREIGVKNGFDARENVFGGVRYLKSLFERFNRNLELALSAYNAGPTAVEKYKGIPPFPETQRYVQKVINVYRKL